MNFYFIYVSKIAYLSLFTQIYQQIQIRPGFLSLLKMANLQVEAEECLCSARCKGEDDHCAGGEAMTEECICTALCKGRESHAGARERSEDIDGILGLKYCPGLEPDLPGYIYVEYKP